MTKQELLKELVSRGHGLAIYKLEQEILDYVWSIIDPKLKDEKDKT